MSNKLIDLHSLETGVKYLDLQAANSVIQDYLVDTTDYTGNFASRLDHRVHGIDNTSNGLQVEHFVSLSIAVTSEVKELDSPEVFMKVLATTELKFSLEPFSIAMSHDEASGFIIYIYGLKYSGLLNQKPH